MHRNSTDSTLIRKSTSVRAYGTEGKPRLGQRILAAAWKGAPGVVEAWLARRMLTPRRHPEPGRERRWRRAAVELGLSVDGRRLPAWSWGDGPTVLLVHGWEGRGSQLGALVAPLVERGFRVVTWDAPAHGRAPGRRTSLVEMARVVTVAAERWGAVHGLVAHSAGALAATYALRRPLPVSKVAYLAPGEDLLSYLHHGVVHRLGLPEEVVGSLRRRLEARVGVDFLALRGRLLAQRQTAPLLVVHDVEDREAPFAGGLTLANAWPGARLRRVRGLGHRRLLRDPGVVASVVDFLLPTVGRRGAEAGVGR